MEVAARRAVNGAWHVTFEDMALARERWIGNRYRIQQADGVGMLRVGKQLLSARCLDYAAKVHHRHPVADVFDNCKIMGDKKIRNAELSLQVREKVNDLGLD